MENNKVYNTSEKKGFTDEQQIKMWETEIIMHMQTLKQARNNTKSNPNAIQKIEDAINENFEKIKRLNPSYVLPHNETNIEDEKHSSFNPKDEHIIDTEGMNSKYSGEKNFISDKADTSDLTAETQRFLDSLKRKEVPEEKHSDEAVNIFKKIHENTNTEKEKKDIDTVVDSMRNDKSLSVDNIQTDSNVEYDLVPIPSRGECYKSKKKRLSVAYLTAYDENMITSPNLYEGNLISEFLLKHKILDKDINIMDLTNGDADAILVWLRKTGYGNDYPVTVTDRQTGQDFNATVNLDDIKVAEFKLTGDENGLFDYHCDVCGADIKFRFLTLADTKAIDSKLKIETEDVRKNYVGTLLAKIKSLVNDDTNLTDENKKILTKSLDVTEAWSASKSDENYSFANSITDSLERMIVSVNGRTDREYIKHFIQKLPALDSLKFRKYVNENEPHMDFRVKIDRPADLGGGQTETFLKWDKYVFTNTSVL